MSRGMAVAVRVLNIHERELPSSAVGELIDSLLSSGDRLWPKTLLPACDVRWSILSRRAAIGIPAWSERYDV
jgi:hypothetical protein